MIEIEKERKGCIYIYRKETSRETERQREGEREREKERESERARERERERLFNDEVGEEGRRNG